MNRIAKFEKVSFEEFKKSWQNTMGEEYDFTDEESREIYDSIELPTRSTTGSAGYDFKSFFEASVLPGDTILIPTGIRVQIDDGWLLAIVPRSSYGFKYRAQLDNTIGIIDSDYYHSSSNEGHIMIKLTNDSKTSLGFNINPGDKYVQGIFLPFGITVDDDVTGIRDGGFGSTDGKQ